MNTILRLSTYLVIALMAFSCSSTKKMAEPQNVILPLSDPNALREGSIVYGLPRTVFTFSVEFERTIEKPGPYARYAGDLLGLDKVITEENESWTIEGVSVNSHEELDPSEFYIIESNSLFQTNVLALKKEGLILDLNPESLNSSGIIRPGNEQDVNQFSNRDLGSDEYYMVQSDTAYKRLSIDSSFVRVPYVVEKKKKLTTDQLAERAAKRLMEMREGKHLILTGEANVFPQSDAAIIEMNRLEKEYMELFTGKTIRQKVAYTYNIIPGRENDNKQIVLFQFSELTGPLNASGKGGTPVTLDIVPEQKTKDLAVIKKQQAESVAQRYDKLYYRVPDMVNLKVSMAPEVFLNTRKLVYQFGQVVQLPANYIIGR
jgi:Domain of unknown function (DUF4831)